MAQEYILDPGGDHGKGSSSIRSAKFKMPTSGRRRSFSCASTRTWVFLALLLTLLPVLTKGIDWSKNPLRPGCDLISERFSLSDDQKTCLNTKIDQDFIEGFSSLTGNPGWVAAKTIITGNPTGYPKLSFITFFKGLIGFLCEVKSTDTFWQDGNLAGVFATAAGGNQRPLQAFEYILDKFSALTNKIYVACGGLEKAPKIGFVFGALKKGLKFPNKKLKGTKWTRRVFLVLVLSFSHFAALACASHYTTTRPR
jgi:hypothetical protein